MFKKIAVPVLLAFSGVAAAAEGKTTTGVDLTPLTNSIDFSTVLVAIMAVAASLVTLYAGVAGVRWVLRTVKSA
ncbi:hypothetical protein ATR52_01140 [Salmonella enterica subsp. enterica serovar Rubislaw]|nr:hypothetical protein [Salmonella enterica subsp. enterica serovar Rubislaw]ECX3423052.1 hypothetical protein [Salmonella enterica subsp. enterica serovar Rubislaw]ECX6379707.1 hypothetical protein [Salmonella enterica subsp. enterica serovar Rubislaw]EEC2009454.1 hypothetical protein [Salmonella enterica subsp. enterica serovar Rubislaw]